MIMKTKETLTPLTSKEVVKLATAIRNKLAHFGVDLKKSDALDGLPVHLADTYEVCVAYTSMVRALLELKVSQINEATNLTEQIDYQLYDHLPYHLKRLLPGLRAFSKNLDKQRKKSPKSSVNS